MKFKNIKLKIKNPTIIFIILFNLLLNPLVLKGMQPEHTEEEQSRITPPIASSSDQEDAAAPVPLQSAQVDLRGFVSRVDEESNLVVRSNALSTAYIHAFQDNNGARISKYQIFKYAVCLIGAVGPIIPQLVIPRLIGEEYDSKFLGYLLTGTTILTIEGIASWMIWELITDTEKLVKATREHQANKGFCNLLSIKEVGLGVLSLILGVFSSAPDVYKTYKYNSIKEFAIISFIYDSIPHTIGFYKLLSSLNSRRIKKVCGQENSAEQKGTKLVNVSKAYFLDKCDKSSPEEVASSLDTLTTPAQIYSYLTTGVDSTIAKEDSPEYFAKGIPRKIVQCLSIIPPLSTAVGLSMVFSYNGYSLFIEDQTSLIFLSTFSVLPAFLLNTYVITRAAGNLFDKLYSCKSKVPSTEYFTYFHPKLNATFVLGALALGTATSVSGFFLITDNLEGTILSPVKYLLASFAVGTDLTFGTYTIYNTMRRYGEVIKEKLNRGASYIFSCLRKLTEVSSSFASHDANEIETFIHEFDQQEAL